MPGGLSNEPLGTDGLRSYNQAVLACREVRFDGGRFGRVVAETEIVTSSSASSNIRAIVDLPAPDGDESTMRRPRRWRVGWSMAVLASGEPCTSSDEMVHCTKKLLKWCGAMHIVHCNNSEEITHGRRNQG